MQRNVAREGVQHRAREAPASAGACSIRPASPTDGSTSLPRTARYSSWTPVVGPSCFQFPNLTGSPLIYGAASAVPGDGGFYAVLPDGKLHALR
jgi:hypothetical protein